MTEIQTHFTGMNLFFMFVTCQRVKVKEYSSTKHLHFSVSEHYQSIRDPGCLEFSAYCQGLNFSIFDTS